MRRVSVFRTGDVCHPLYSAMDSMSPKQGRSLVAAHLPRAFRILGTHKAINAAPSTPKFGLGIGLPKDSPA